MYQFSDSPNQAHPTVSLVSRPSAASGSNPIGQPESISPVYGVVPYLTSSRESLGESPNSKHLTMTSSPPVSIDQLIPTSGNDSLVVSIPRSLTQFQLTQSTFSYNPSVTNPQMSANPSSVSLGGSRRKVLQNLAKKIAQKSRKFTTNSHLPSSQQRSILTSHLQSVPSSVLPERACTSCRRGNPADKKRCIYCGSVLGRSCPTCGLVNQSSSTSCAQCHTNLTYTWKVPTGEWAVIIETRYNVLLV